MSKKVRVRFAPSPTGPLHIGGVRTALFNYLFAKKNGGTFYLRIEDTDQTRFVAKAEKYIFESLEWLGIAPDETVNKNEKFGPYRQSERKTIYKEYADLLVKNGWAYYAFDSSEELDKLRKEAELKKEVFIYNHEKREYLETSIKLSEEETNEKIKKGETYVIRFKTPKNEIIEIEDMIRGNVKFDSNLLDDKVLYKSDGMPTYHLANIVDDYLMETTHVIRGEEWLPSLPLHYLLYKAFEWEAPKFAHLPLILKPIGNGKLSKRDGDKLGFPVFPINWINENGEISIGYREQGYLPEAVINFLALLGWNDGTDKEIYSLNELIENFDLSRINKSGAKFDPEKNKWFNQQYIQTKKDEELSLLYKKELEEKGIIVSENKIEKIISLIKDRANLLTDFWKLSDYFFETPNSYDEKIIKKWDDKTKDLLTDLKKEIEKIEFKDSKSIEISVKNWINENQIGMGKIMQPLRVSLVGELKGPDLFDIIELLGKEETLKRIENLINQL